MGRLKAGGQSSANACACAYPNTSFVKSGGIGDTSELGNFINNCLTCDFGLLHFQLSGPKGSWWVIYE
jgi:hypothetical protein